MADKSKIEWTDATWNPVVGCSKVSPGCAHCYAERVAARLRAMALADLAAGRNPGRKRHYIDAVDEQGRWTGKLIPCPEALADPLRWKRPRRVFVNSMSDLFHGEVPLDFIAGVFATMAATPHHTYQILTKRPERMPEFFEWFPAHYNGPRRHDLESQSSDFRRQFLKAAAEVPWPLENVWLGTSVENQSQADIRIPPLLQTPAAVRFLSIEPLLGPVDIADWLTATACPKCGTMIFKAVPTEETWCSDCCIAATKTFAGATGMTHGMFPTRSIDWVIVGGESGPGARPMHPAWVRSIRDQCLAAGVPLFFKQWGEWIPISQMRDGWNDELTEISEPCRGFPEGKTTYKVPTFSFRYDPASGIQGHTMYRVGKQAAGHLLDGVEWQQFPETAGVNAS